MGASISIHALLAESDIRRMTALPFLSIFLSTLSLRRATRAKSGQQRSRNNFYPRSPCGERHMGQKRLRQKLAISIHALLAESDHCDTLSALTPKQFLSTLSLRRATNSAYGALDGASISIHALLAESDWDLTGGLSCDAYFYPRSPCGERRSLLCYMILLT